MSPQKISRLLKSTRYDWKKAIDRFFNLEASGVSVEKREFQPTKNADKCSTYFAIGDVAGKALLAYCEREEKLLHKLFRKIHTSLHYEILPNISSHFPKFLRVG